MDIAIGIENGVVDLSLNNGDLKVDDGLESAIIISLFCDARVGIDELPQGEEDLRGFWGDIVGEEGDSTGSKLWLLGREKLTRSTATRAKQYCEDALRWLVGDKIAKKIVINTRILGASVLGIDIEVERPSGDVSYKFEYVWQSQGA